MVDDKTMGNTPRTQSSLAWTVSDVARELQCTERHIYKLVSDGKIPYAKVGRLVRFSPAQVEEWIRRGGTR
jgi:excisionase family DNA binding protein